MELKDAIRKKSSIREYENKPVSENKLLNVLEAARLAPSGANRQYWKFVVVQDPQRRQELAKASGGQNHVAQAPVVIAAVATMPEGLMRCGVPGYAVDLAIAVDHMTLQAVELGLGTCWICNFDVAKCKQILNLPKHVEPIVLLPVAYPLDSPNLERHNNGRKKLDKIVHWEKF